MPSNRQNQEINPRLLWMSLLACHPAEICGNGFLGRAWFALALLVKLLAEAIAEVARRTNPSSDHELASCQRPSSIEASQVTDGSTLNLLPARAGRGDPGTLQMSDAVRIRQCCGISADWANELNLAPCKG